MTTVLLQAAEHTSWPEAAIVVGGITMVTVITAIAIWQVLTSWRAKMSIAREEAYRTLAEQTAKADARIAEQQERTADNLKSISDRLTGIEKVLREVG